MIFIMGFLVGFFGVGLLLVWFRKSERFANIKNAIALAISRATGY